VAAAPADAAPADAAPADAAAAASKPQAAASEPKEADKPEERAKRKSRFDVPVKEEKEDAAQEDKKDKKEGKKSDWDMFAEQDFGGGLNVSTDVEQPFSEKNIRTSEYRIALITN